MEKEIKFEYNKESDSLHIYSDDIKQGVKGCIEVGYSTIDVGMDNSIVGIEIEQASKIFQTSPEFLEDLDDVDLKVMNIDNSLFVGVNLVRGEEKSNLQLNFPVQEQLVVS